MYDYATCNLSSLPIFTVLTSGHFIWTTLNSASCFLVYPRKRLKRQSQCVNLSLLVSARVLDDFRGISCFVIFNVTRAVFGDSAEPYAFGRFVVTASRCEVATHAATFCSLVVKTP